MNALRPDSTRLNRNSRSTFCFLFALLAVVATSSVYAENPEDPGEPDGGQSCPICPKKKRKFAAPSCESNSSHFWGIQIGQINAPLFSDFAKVGQRATSARTNRSPGAGTGGGAGMGASPQNRPAMGMNELDELVTAYTERDELGMAPLMLEMVAPPGPSFDPSLEISGGEVYRAGGGPGYMTPSGASSNVQDDGPPMRILSATAFADIDYFLPDPGFHIRIWPRTTQNRGTFEGGVLPSTLPVQEVVVTFDAPGPGFVVGSPWPTKQRIVTTERFGAAGEHVTCQIREIAGDVLTVTTHLGGTDAGPVLKKETITHSNYGEFKWDYTVERVTEEATTDLCAEGKIGCLAVIARTKEVYGDYSKWTPMGRADALGGFNFTGGAKDGRRLLSITHGYGDPSFTTSNLTTRYQYDDGGSSSRFLAKESLGRFLWMKGPDGSWRKNNYAGSPYAPASSAFVAQSWLDVTFDNYTSGRISNTLLSPGKLSQTESIDGQIIDKSNAVNVIANERRFTLTSARGTDERNYTNENKPEIFRHEDGSYTTWKYSHQGLTSIEPGIGYGVPTGFTVTKRQGRFSEGEKDVVEGTQTITSYNRYFQMLSEEVSDVASGIVTFHRAADLSYGSDRLETPMKYIYNGNPDDYSIEERTCCGINFQRERDGSTTEYFYDGLKRPYKIISKASSIAPEVMTLISYQGLATQTERVCGGVTLLVEEVTKNLAGDIIELKTPDQDGDGQPEVTTYTTEYPSNPNLYNNGVDSTSGGRKRTTTYPDGSTKIETTYRDGQLKSVTGTAVPDVYYEYGTHNLNGGGLWKKEIKGSATGTEWVKSYFDAADHEFKTEYPDNTSVVRTYHPEVKLPYQAISNQGAIGRLASVSDADGVVTSYGYDKDGNVASVTDPMPAAQHRITQVARDVVEDTALGATFRTRTTINGVLVSAEYEGADGLGNRREALGIVTSWNKTFPADGAWVESSVTGDGQKLVKTFTEGELLKSEYLDNQDQPVSSTEWIYDGFGRVMSAEDSRTGVSSYNGYTESGNLLSITDPGGRTTAYKFDKAGRTVEIDQPDTLDAGGATVANVTHTSYYPSGEISAVWGDQTNATYRIYDEQNRLTGLRTYRSLAHGVQPAVGTSGYDSTSWSYDSQRGWLIAKRDHASLGADYTYTPGGRLASRKWARLVGGTRVTTEYEYDAGKVTIIAYNDGLTTDVNYAYDAFGRQTVVTQGGNSWAYTYDPGNLRLTEEIVTYDTDSDGIGDLSRTLERNYDTMLRSAGYVLADGTFVESGAEYTYDDAGRLATVADAMDTFSYSYVGGSLGLLQSVSGPVHSVINTWDTTRDALLAKENQAGPDVISRYEYTVNQLGQRTVLSADGIAFAGARTIGWGYNARGEVTSADHSDPAQSRFYEFDAMGNRRKSRNGAAVDSGGTLVNYTASSLNQYSAIGGTTPVYDTDGNQLGGPLPADPSKTAGYVWDAENRLIEASADSVVVGVYRYDPFGRRICKESEDGGRWFFYDEWNPIAERNAEGAVLSDYLWGQDLSGTLQGAGGVGGLLSSKDPNLAISNEQYPLFDGNGNIFQYLDLLGSLVASYEYDAFGSITSGGQFFSNPAFGFSTKYWDAETGLNYYGYRHYDPQQGRWLSRDPIGEGGGVNFYSFVENIPLAAIDGLGLADIKINGEIWNTPAVVDNDHIHVDPQTGEDMGRHMHGPDGQKYFPEKGKLMDKNGNVKDASKKFKKNLQDAARSQLNKANLKKLGFAGIVCFVGLLADELSGENDERGMRIRDNLDDFASGEATVEDFAELAADISDLTGNDLSAVTITQAIEDASRR